jgi:ketosteroid isomerase-like protein
LQALLCGHAAVAEADTGTVREILALERRAMDGWARGDPDPFLAVADPEITYFHVMTDKRLDGLPALKALFEIYRGRPLFDGYEIVDPKIQSGGDLAVATYIFVRRIGSATSRWNATQVYRRTQDGWRIIHSHFSMTKPPLTGAPQP